MANTIVVDVATGNTSVFSVPFPYLDKSHTHVFVDGLETTNFVWTDAGNVQLLGGNPPSGSLVGRRRITPTTPLVHFSPGNLASADLNLGDLQPLYVAEESRDWGDRNSILLQALEEGLKQEVINRATADAILSARLDSLLGSIAESLQASEEAAQRSAASAKESEEHAAISHELVEKAVAGFTGFTEGMAYDLGWGRDPLTYFNRDLGLARDPVT